MTTKRPLTTICIPAHNEEHSIVEAIRLAGRSAAAACGLVAEIVVVDDRSTDATAELARAAGARVVRTEDECATFGGALGKGDAVWTGLRTCRSELITFLDADISGLDPRFVRELNMPMVRNQGTKLVKGRYRRGDGAGSSGRVTMLTARPLLSLLHPELSGMLEPLGGIFAGRVDVLGDLWLDCDYGVDVGILIDVAVSHGVGSVIEVDIGTLRHRNRGLDELSTTARQVARAILARSSQISVMHDDISVRRAPSRRPQESFTSG